MILLWAQVIGFTSRLASEPSSMELTYVDGPLPARAGTIHFILV